MSVGSGLAISRRASLAGYVAGALAMGAVAMAGTFAAHATETLKLKTAISIPNGGKITSFDISFVDTVTGTYLLADRTNKGIDVIDTATNTIRFIAGQGLFKGALSSNDISGPDGTMITPLGEIWAGDGDSTLKFLSLFNGALLGQVATSTTPPLTRVDEMCFDSVHFIGFVANNAASPPFVTAVDAFSHQILGQIVFDGNHNGAPKATNGIEQCAFNPRDNMIYLAVPEIDGNGDNSSPGGVVRIDPLTLQITATAVIPTEFCSGPQGLAIGPVVGNYGQMLTGCNGAVFNAASNRPTAIIDDGSASGVFGNPIALPFQAGNDMVSFNPTDNHYYLARSGNNSFANPAPDPVTGIVYGCPDVTGKINYGGAIYTKPNELHESFGSDTTGPSFAGPAALGMVNALTLENDPDTITGLANCSPTSPGPGGVGKSNAANAHGASHSVAADPAHNQVYVPVASTAFAAGMTGLCAQGGGTDSLGCIAVFQIVGSD